MITRYSSSSYFGSSHVYETPDLVSGTLVEPVTLTTGARTAGGLAVIFSSTSTNAEQMRIQLNSGTTIWDCGPINGPKARGVSWKAKNTTSGSYAAFNAAEDPACLELPDGTGQGSKIWCGDRVPNIAGSSIGNAQPGDFYWRLRTSGTSLVLYICTVAGSPGTWVAVT